MGRCFAKHSMTSSKVCSSVRTGAIAGVFTYATSKQMLSMVGGSLNLRRLKFKAIRDGIPLWRKVFDLLIMTTLRRTWQRHYDRVTGAGALLDHPERSGIRFKPHSELPPAAEGIESPYDPEARYRQKCDTQWTGYMVHVSETCEPSAPHLLTQVHTTPATVHEAQCTVPIQQALIEKEMPPR